jgi:hypothetical protein
LAEVRVVVDADDVEEVPVDLVVLGGGVAEVAVEDGTARRRRLLGERVQPALHLRRVERAVQDVLDAVQDRRAGHDPGYEQPELAAHAEVDARALPPEAFREPAGLREVFEDVPLRDVGEGGLEPDVQAEFGGLGGGGGEAVDAVAGDVDRVGVQLVADGAEVGAHPAGVPGGGGGLALADRVDDAVVA